MANTKVFTAIAESLPAKSTSLVQVLNSRTASPVNMQHAMNLRTVSHQPLEQSWRKSPPKKKLSKVDAWSNGLRESLQHNLTYRSISRSKCASPIGGIGAPMRNNAGNNETSSYCDNLRRFSEHDRQQSQPQNKVEQEEVQSSLEYDVNQLVDSAVPHMLKGVKHQKAREADEKNWATILQKTVDLNVNDISNTKSERKNLSMDINVIVKIKPYENENKIGFQQIAHKKKMEHIEKDKSEKERVRLCNDEITTHNQHPKLCAKSVNEDDSQELQVTKDKNIIEIECAEEDLASLMSQEILTRELAKVYSFHKNQGDSNCPVYDTDKNLPEDVARSLTKLKELYLKSLSSAWAMDNNQSNPIEMQEKQHVPSGSTTQNISSNCGTTTGISGSTQSPLDISNVMGTCCQTISLTPGVLGTTSRRTFTTSSSLFEKKGKKDDCDKAKKLPCLQASKLSKTKADTGSHKAVCEKFCMPCCKPARDPPECFYPYHKPPCKKHKPPRPSFSECKQLFPLRQIQPCECIRPRGSTCKKSKESAKCSK